MRSHSVSLTLAALVALSAPGPGFALDITSCDSVVPKNQVGELRNDLVCTHTTGRCADQPELACDVGPFGIGCPSGPCINMAVVLGDRATLRLNGHEIHGTEMAVVCRRGCSVEGGGGLIADAGIGIRQWSRKRMSVSDTRFENDGWAINAAYFARRMTLRNVAVDGLGTGIYGTDVVATNVHVADLPGCGYGGSLYADKLRGTSFSAGYVYVQGRIDVSDLTVLADCGNGLVSAKGRIKLTDSSITGASQADVLAFKKPSLTNTVCNRSAVIDKAGVPTGADWGVCALD